MNGKFEYKGIWWLPDNPNNTVSGTLKFTPNEGAILDLIGSFMGSLGRMIRSLNLGQSSNQVIILGISSNGKYITLYKCSNVASTFSSPGLLTSSYKANYVFVGAHADAHVGVHFQKLEDIKFESFSIHYSHLDEWVNISGFDIKWLRGEKGTIIKYKLPDPIEVVVNNDLKVLITFQARGPLCSFMQKEATIKQKTEIGIKTSEKKSFEDYIKNISHIQNFLSLGIMEPVHPLAITGFIEVNNTDSPPVEIFYQQSEISKAHKPLHPSDMLFTYEDISNEFESFLRKWFEKFELLKPIYDLYFGTLYNPRMYLEHHFLSIIQAIESFHQRIYGGEYLSDEEYREIYDALVAAIPDNVESDLKNRLKGSLKYGNGFSLRTRLKVTFNKYHEILDTFISNRSTFINNVVDTRNYQTHHGEDLKERAVNGIDLYHLTQKLKRLLEICLLTELGFSLEKIKELFLKNRRSNHEIIAASAEVAGAAQT